MTLVYLATNKFKVREAEMVLGKQYGIELEIINPDFEILFILEWSSHRREGS